MKVDVAVLGSPGVPNKPDGFCGSEATLTQNTTTEISLMVSVRKATLNYNIRKQELCGSGGGRPGLPIPNKPDGFCGCKAALNYNTRAQELCEQRGGPGLSFRPQQAIWFPCT